MKHSFLWLLIWACAVGLHGQQMDNPVTLPVYYYGEGIVSSSGVPWSGYTITPGFGPAASASGSYLTGGSYVFTNLATALVIPGKEYVVQVTSTNFAVVHVHFPSIPGYDIYLGPTAATSRMNSITLGTNYSFRFRLEAINDLTSSMGNRRGGESSSLTEDKAIWYVGLGKLRGGRPAGAVGFRAPSITSSLYTTSALMYDVVDSSEVSLTRNGSGHLTSVTAREVKLVMTTLSTNSYKIDVYQSQSLSTPYITYTVQQYGAGTAIRIIKSEGGTHWATRLEQSGTTWTHYDWRASDASGNFSGTAGVYPFPDKRAVTSTSGTITTTNYGITNAVSTPKVVKQRTHADYGAGWGKELTNVTWGPGVSQAPSTSYTFYTNTTGGGWPRAIATMVEPTGKWTKYDYYNAAQDSRGGLVHRIYRPWLDSPTAPGSATTTNCLVETYDYAANFDNTLTAPSSRETRINNTLVAKTAWSYNFSTTANGHGIALTTQTDYANGSSSLTTTTQSYRLDASVSFLQGKPHAVARPDGTKDSYAYYFGAWDATARSFNPNGGSDRLILCLHGQSATGTGATLINAWTVNPSGGTSVQWNVSPVYLIGNLSTISETVIDTNGRVVFQAENIFNGTSSGGIGNNSSLERISGTAYTYNGNNLLTKQLDITRSVSGVEVAVTNTYFASGLLQRQTAIDGSRTDYTYDNHLRNETIKTAAGGSSPYPEKTQSFTYNLGDLKETSQDCDCSPTITTFEYETTGRLMWSQEPRPGGGDALRTNYVYNSPRLTTVTLPTGGTLITELYYDGRLKSATGTGQEATYHDYTAASYTINHTTRHGTATAYPWSQQVLDGLGRVTQDRSPQVGWTTSLTNRVVRKTYTYGANGQLTKLATTDEAAGNARLLPDRLYIYGNLGMLVQEGDDLGSNGFLDAASTDRITTYSTTFYKDNPGYNGWIRQDLVKVYRTLNSPSDITTTLERRTRYTRFNNGGSSSDGAAISDVVELDASGRWSVALEWVDPAARKRKRTFVRLGTGQESTVWQDGYLETETSSTGVVRTSAYNPQGLLASVTEGTTGAESTYAYFSGTSHVQTETMTTGPSTTAATSYAYFWATPNPTETSAYKVRKTDAASKVTHTEYDLKGRLWHVWGSGSAPSETGYDNYGRRNSLKTWRSGTFTAAAWPGPGGADTTTWTVDAASGAVTAKVYPNSTSVGYTYNPRGQVNVRTWARGVTTTHAYHSLTGELTGKTYSDGTTAVGFTYNRFGALATATDAAGTRTFAYHANLNLNTESLPAFFGSKTLTTTYDGSVPGRVTGYSYNGNVTVALARAFNSVGRVSTVTGTHGGSSTTFTMAAYQAGSDWVSSVTNGSYARALPLVGRYDVIASATTTWGGAERARFVAKYEELRGYRNKLESGNAAGTPAESWSKKLGLGDGYRATLTYDDYGRLDNNVDAGLVWQNTAGTQNLALRNVNWNFDLMGNRTGGNTDWGGTTTYTVGDNVPNGAYASLNEYSAITGAKAESVLKYDTDGNLTQDGTWTYTYDGENRVKSMTGGVTLINFNYDYLGRRISKGGFIGATPFGTRYVWSGWTQVADTATDGFTIRRSFIWGPDFSDAQGNAGGAGSLLGQYSAGAVLTYAVPDAQGSIVGYLNTSGNFVAAWEFSPFGERINSFGGSVADYPIGYSGKYTDSESGLVYYGYRYYNPKHGRFINRDPIEEAGGNNLFAFVGNAPTRGWDVLGLLQCWLDTWFWYGTDFETGRIGVHVGTSWSCVDNTPPAPSLSSGSFSPPEIAVNLGWDRDWRRFDPRGRAANSAWGFRGNSPAGYDQVPLADNKYEPIGTLEELFPDDVAKLEIVRKVNDIRATDAQRSAAKKVLRETLEELERKNPRLFRRGVAIVIANVANQTGYYPGESLHDYLPKIAAAALYVYCMDVYRKAIDCYSYKSLHDPAGDWSDCERLRDAAVKCFQISSQAADAVK